DRLIHLFDASQNYTHMVVIDDHSSSISSVKFLPPSADSPLEMVTCGTDKLIVIRQLELSPEDSSLQTRRVNQISSQHGPNYLQVLRDGSIMTAWQDRQLRNYASSGKMLKAVKGNICEEGTLTKVGVRAM